MSVKGLTLIELLVVVVILSILLAVIIFAVDGSDDDAKKNACTEEKETVQVATKEYKPRTMGRTLAPQLPA